VILGAGLAVLAAAAPGDVAGAHSSPDVVLKWNQLIQSTLPPPGNPLTPRFYAMTHIAMFDAVNAIEREFEPYRVRLRSGARGSTTAAAAQAAHDVLVALNPTSAPAYDEALAADLGDNPSGFVRRGAAIGARVASEVLAWRQQDGWVASTFPPYVEPPLPGRWQPTPPAHAGRRVHPSPAGRADGARLGDPVPSPAPSAAHEPAIRGRSQRGQAPGQIGRRGTDRGADGHRPAVVGRGHDDRFFPAWNNVARDVARGLPLVDTARVFVLVNVSIHEALQTTQASKFVYGMWRPVTAIRAADLDLNPETDPDPTWLPLITTPPIRRMPATWRPSAPARRARSSSCPGRTTCPWP
jgi:hypothetical protein